MKQLIAIFENLSIEERIDALQQIPEEKWYSSLSEKDRIIVTAVAVAMIIKG